MTRSEKSGGWADTPKLTTSLAAFTLICFFLPWFQMSCVGLRDSVSGLDLARGGERALWLAPLAMLLVILVGITGFIRQSAPSLFGIMSIVGGGLNAYLMFRKHSGAARWEGLIDTHWTVWYWLGIVASLGVVASGLIYYARRVRAP